MAERLHIVICPYLPLDERRRVGTWEVIPFSEFSRADARNSNAERRARQLFHFYGTPDPEPQTTKLGAVLRRTRGKVGDRIRRSAIDPLHQAILLGALDTNPSGDDGFGRAMVTSDNAEVWGHPVDESGRVSSVYGMVVQTLIGGLRLGDPEARYRHPPEIPEPMFGRNLDERYTDAVWRILDGRTPLGRHVDAAARWLDIAWRNTPSLTLELRVLALYSGFEALFAPVSGRRKLAAKLSRELDPPRARKRPHRWKPHPSNRTRIDQFTDLEWWMIRFGDARNAIAHGDTVDRGMLRHGGQWHFRIAERRLRQAIAAMVSRRVGLPELQVDYGERAIKWAWRDAGLTF